MQIENDVPSPDKTTAYPFRYMQIGQSVFIDGEDTTGNAAAAARIYGRRTGKKFMCRSEGTGCRIWRVEPRTPAD